MLNIVGSPPPALVTSSTRPSSRADRKIRFAELSPQDVHVYESAPPSPRRKALALPPPSDDGSAISLGEWKGKMVGTPADMEGEVEPEEGTAEYIRRRYFPDAPINDPNLAWMDLPSSSSAPDNVPPSLRFDLTGAPISPSMSSSLPTHLGLHHHADGEHAGYTLDDVFLLSRSTVPAQRATMLSVLARIARRIAKMRKGEVDGMSEVEGKEEEVRKRIVAAGVEAMAERGGLGARAIEVVWECVVGWDASGTDFEGVELETPADAAINSLPLDFLLPQIATSFAQGDLVSESSSQLLAILHRLAKHNNTTAVSIVETPKLISNILQIFLLTPIPPIDTSPPPDPNALDLLTTLALSSRPNARALEEQADTLLRFVTLLPSDALYPVSLATSLLTSTLRFYTALASYGICAHIATTAMEQFTRLGQYVVSEACTSRKLKAVWASLLGAWTICAVDPHRTTPSHEILWSQITGWSWSEEVMELRERLEASEKDWEVWASVWGAEAAWLEGSRINGVKGGLAERLECVNVLKTGFETGKERDVINGVLGAIQQELLHLKSTRIDGDNLPHFRLLAGHADVLTTAIRLWLACLPPISEGLLESPPFPLPFSQISALCAKLVTQPFWSSVYAQGSIPCAYVFCRPVANLLSAYVRFSERLPGISEELWIAQAFTILSKLLPGDEESALQVMNGVISILTADWVASKGIQAYSIIWEKGGMSVVRPFLEHTVRPKEDTYIGPLRMSPQSIMLATTQRLPSMPAMHESGLPLKRDWTLTPMDHLLRSGSSSVFKALPMSWDASEAEVTRASLLFTQIAREILQRFSLTDFVLSREEAVFGCMKVFMLEHGQPQNDSVEEVFRDSVVGQLMKDLLHPYTAAAGRASLGRISAQEDLEKVAVRFLGPSTPFYQYYTDFVALYDAISFSHPLFARLILPPTSMRYAVDYRRHLWSDFGHVLKTIRTPFDQVISADIAEYLWPIESDAQMIGVYLRALVSGSLQEFVRLVALHHLACNIWPDLLEETRQSDERASKLLRAIVDQGDIDAVREIVRYRQPTAGSVVLPPDCFGGLGEVRDLRLECVKRWGGEALVRRVEGLFNE